MRRLPSGLTVFCFLVVTSALSLVHYQEYFATTEINNQHEARSEDDGHRRSPHLLMKAAAADDDGYYWNHSGNYAAYDYTSKRAEAAQVGEDDVVLVKAAPCGFHEKAQYLSHFPHTMQAIYPCFDFWREHAEYPPLFVYHNHQKGSFVDHPSKKSRWNDGIFALLEQKIGLKVLSMAEYRNSTLFYHPNQTIQSFQSSTFRDGYLTKHVDDWLHLVQEPKVKGASFWSKIGHFKNSDTPSNTYCQGFPPRIRILNRKISSRKLLNENDILTALRSSLLPPNRGPPSWRRPQRQKRTRADVQVEYLDSASFQEQVSFFRNTDILIAPHGAALTGVLFMGGSHKPCSQLMEIFPENFALPSFFGTLAVQSGISHSYIYLPSTHGKWNNTDHIAKMGTSITDKPLPLTAMLHDNRTHGDPMLKPWQIAFYQDVESQKIARIANLLPNVDFMLQAVQSLVDDWYECCHDIS